MDVYWSIAPIFGIAKTLGLAPLRLAGEIGRRKCHVSKLSLVYSVIICVSITSFRMYTYRGFPRHKITPLILTIQFYYDVFLAVFLVAISTIHSRALASILFQIDQIDYKMTTLLFDITKNHLITRRWGLIRVVTSAIAISGVIFQVAYILYLESTSDIRAYINWVLYFIVELINYSSSCVFIQCISIVEMRYKIINENISRLMLFTRDETVDQIMLFYCKLCDLSKEINSLYSVKVLLYIVSVFVNITTGSNNCFEDMLRISMKENNAALNPYIVFGIYVVFLFTMQITSMVFVCVNTSAQAHHTPWLIHKMFVDKSRIFDRSKLRLFSLQLLQRKVQFTACSFFPIDATLLYTIVGAVTTYLVILIQLQLP